jgi:hypothetical protein
LARVFATSPVSPTPIGILVEVVEWTAAPACAGDLGVRRHAVLDQAADHGGQQG